MSEIPAVDDQGEAWRPISDWPNYEVSSLGRVRSLPRQRTRGGILKHGRDGNGYHMIGLSRPGLVKRFRVHKLVAEAFIGPCPEGQEVRHLNDIKDDNTVANIAYGTRSQNIADAVRNGRFSDDDGKRLPGWNSTKTHCLRGHPYDEANTRYVKGQYGLQRLCRTCVAARRRGELTPVPRPARASTVVKSRPTSRPRVERTHCRRNHEFTPENIYTGPDGRRRCRACGIARFQRRDAARAAARARFGDPR